MGKIVKTTDEAGGGASPDMTTERFRELGYAVVDRVADFYATMAARPVAPDASPERVRAVLGSQPLPETGSDPADLLEEASHLLFEYNRLTGHPRQWGYVIGSAAPIGALADFLAAAANPNLASWPSAPMATEIEVQTVRWIAELLGYPADCGGLLTSGGNMANFIGFLAARRAKAGPEVRAKGMAGARLRLYVSEETHTWIQKAADMFGLGTDSIRWIGTDDRQRIDVAALKRRIAEDAEGGDRPFLVVGSAGTVSTGAVDPLPELAAIAREFDMWFHVDGAYGAPAVVAPGTPSDLEGLREADSIAVDAHKWLYAPLEAGCALVRDRQALLDAFSYRPPYYHHGQESGEELVHFYELGPQNSSCFRALKVWLFLRQLGRADYAKLVARDLEHARELFDCMAAAPGIEAVTQGLSIATFRYVPADLAPGDASVDAYLDRLNAELLTRLLRGGEAYVSNAVVDGRYLLRACITNFRTTSADVQALPEIVTRLGREVDAEIRPDDLGRPPARP